jgi:WD40 repeat protein
MWPHQIEILYQWYCTLPAFMLIAFLINLFWRGGLRRIGVYLPYRSNVARSFVYGIVAWLVYWLCGIIYHWIFGAPSAFLHISLFYLIYGILVILVLMKTVNLLVGALNEASLRQTAARLPIAVKPLAAALKESQSNTRQVVAEIPLHGGSSPAGLSPPLGTILCTYCGHTDLVTTVVWSPDGTRIASAGDDTTVQVWDATTGANVLTYKGHSEWVSAVAWAPDGKRIASTGGDITVQVWDAIDGNTVCTVHGHTYSLRRMAWSPDGTRIASTGDDATVQVWDATTGANVLTYKGHSEWVSAVAWSPDGTRIASTGHDATVQVWDATTGANVLTYKDHVFKGCPAPAMAWAPDGKRIASASDYVQVWDAMTGKLLLVFRGRSDAVATVAWSPDGKHIASAFAPVIGHWQDPEGKSILQVWDAISGKELYTYSILSGSIKSAWSPDSRYIAVTEDRYIAVTGDRSMTVELLDAATGKSLCTYCGHTDLVTTVVWSPDGTRIPSGWVTTPAWSPDGKRIASASGDTTVQVWQAETDSDTHHVISSLIDGIKMRE